MADYGEERGDGGVRAYPTAEERGKINKKMGKDFEDTREGTVPYRLDELEESIQMSDVLITRLYEKLDALLTPERPVAEMGSKSDTDTRQSHSPISERLDSSIWRIRNHNSRLESLSSRIDF